MSVNRMHELDPGIFSTNNTHYERVTNPIMSSISFGKLAGVSLNTVLRSPAEWKAEDLLLGLRFSSSITPAPVLSNVSSSFPEDALAVVVSNMNPVVSNRAAIGLNLFTHPARRAFFNLSITSRTPVLTTPISLVQVSNSPGALFIIPSVPASSGEVTHFSVAIIVGKALMGDVGNGVVDISIFDTTNPATPLLLSASRCGSQPEPQLSSEASSAWYEARKRALPHDDTFVIVDLVVHGRKWSLVVCTQNEYLNQALAREKSISNGFVTSLATLLLGLGALLAVAAVSYLIINRKSGEIKRTRSQFREAVADRSAFIANLSNEINSPLASMTGVLAFLLDGGGLDRQGPRETRKDLSMLQSACRSLGRVTNDLFLFSRISSGEAVAIEKSRFDAEGALREVCDLVSEDPMGSLRIVVTPHTLRGNFVAFADYGHVCELFNKIIGLSSQLAAPQGTRPGGPHLVIEVQNSVVRNAPQELTSPHRIELAIIDEESRSLWPASRSLASETAERSMPGPSRDPPLENQDVYVYSFGDNGVGLSPEAVNAVNTGSLTSHSSQGLGLCLFVSIMEDMGGSVSVGTTAGGGSSFTVTIPAVATQPLAHTRVPSGKAEAPRSEMHTPSLSQAGPGLSQLPNEFSTLSGFDVGGKASSPRTKLCSLLAGWRIVIIDDAQASVDFFRTAGFGTEALISTTNLSTVASLVVVGDSRPTLALLGVTTALPEGPATRSGEKTVRDLLHLQDSASCVFDVIVFHPSRWVAEMVLGASRRPGSCGNLGRLLEINHVVSVVSGVLSARASSNPGSDTASIPTLVTDQQRLRKCKAIVIDHNTVSAQSLLDALRMLTIDCIRVEGARPAQKVFDQLRGSGVPVLIFLDLGSDIRDPRAFVSAIRDREMSKGWDASPVIGVCKTLSTQDTRQYEDFTDALYSKPLSITDLKAILEKFPM